MTIIYDMANGSIQSVTEPESDHNDPVVAEHPPAELRLAQREITPSELPCDEPQTAVHLIRALLSSD